MNEATLDRWMTMRMLTPEVGELDVDGYRISVVERPVAKYDEMDPDFEYVLRITKLRAKDTSHDDHMDTLRQWIAADAAAAKEAKPAPKRKAARPKGKAK